MLLFSINTIIVIIFIHNLEKLICNHKYNLELNINNLRVNILLINLIIEFYFIILWV